MKIVKLDVDPQYLVEGFGVIAVDELDSWIEKEQHFCVCNIISIYEPIKAESTVVFFYDIIHDIETELKLMHGSLAHALFLYMLENKVSFEWTE